MVPFSRKVLIEKKESNRWVEKKPLKISCKTRKEGSMDLINVERKEERWAVSLARIAASTFFSFSYPFSSFLQLLESASVYRVTLVVVVEVVS